MVTWPTSDEPNPKLKPLANPGHVLGHKYRKNNNIYNKEAYSIQYSYMILGTHKRTTFPLAGTTQ